MFDILKLGKRTQEVEDGLAAVQRRLTALEVQWGDTLDRLKSMMGRLLKERARTERAREEMGEHPDHLRDEDIGTGQTSLPGMSSRAAQANAAILARRNRNQRPQ